MGRQYPFKKVTIEPDPFQWTIPNPIDDLIKQVVAAAEKEIKSMLNHFRIGLTEKEIQERTTVEKESKGWDTIERYLVDGKLALEIIMQTNTNPDQLKATVTTKVIRHYEKNKK